MDDTNDAPSASHTAPPKVKQAGVGATASCFARYLRPIESVKQLYADNYWKTRVNDLFVIERETCNVDNKGMKVCLLFHHEEFENVELYCDQRFVTIEQEGLVSFDQEERTAKSMESEGAGKKARKQQQQHTVDHDPLLPCSTIVTYTGGGAPVKHVKMKLKACEGRWNGVKHLKVKNKYQKQICGMCLECICKKRKKELDSAQSDVIIYKQIAKDSEVALTDAKKANKALHEKHAQILKEIQKQIDVLCELQASKDKLIKALTNVVEELRRKASSDEAQTATRAAEPTITPTLLPPTTTAPTCENKNKYPTSL